MVANRPKKYFIVRANFSSRFREAHSKNMQEERSSEGQSSHATILPDDMARERTKHIEYHRALKADGKLMCSGPVTDYSYSLSVYMVESEEEAKRIIEADPFYKCGIFTDYQITGWHYKT